MGEKHALGKKDILYGGTAYDDIIGNFSLQIAYVIGGTFKNNEDYPPYMIFWPFDKDMDWFNSQPDVDGQLLYDEVEKAIAEGTFRRSSLTEKVRLGDIIIPTSANVDYISFQLEIYLKDFNRNNFTSPPEKSNRPGYLASTAQIYFMRGETRALYYNPTWEGRYASKPGWTDGSAMISKYKFLTNEGKFAVFPFEGIYTQECDLEFQWDITGIALALVAAKNDNDGYKAIRDANSAAFKDFMDSLEIKVTPK